MVVEVCTDETWYRHVDTLTIQIIQCVFCAFRWVPHTTLFLFTPDNTAISAVVNIRHKLTPYLREEGGHIGYTVAPTFRRRGVGTGLLALTLRALRNGDVTVERDIEDDIDGCECVLVTADSSNVASCKIIQRNGGRPIADRHIDRLGKSVRAFAVPIVPKVLPTEASPSTSSS